MFVSGGDTIGRIIVFELKERDIRAFNDIVAYIQSHSEFEKWELESEPMLSFPGLEINLARRKVMWNGDAVELTAKEFDVLCLLAVNREQVLTYSQIYEKVWGNFSTGNEWVSDAERQPLTIITVKDLTFCLEYRTVEVRGQRIDLTAKEFDILALLITNQRRVFTYEMMMDLIWQEDYCYYSRKAINNHISNLRKKLKIAPDVPDYIKSVHSVGYKFEP